MIALRIAAVVVVLGTALGTGTFSVDTPPATGAATRLSGAAPGSKPGSTGRRASDATPSQVGALTATPPLGDTGEEIILQGTGLAGTTSVKFGGVSAKFVNVSATEVVAQVPAGAVTGLVTATTPSGPAATASNFTVYPVSCYQPLGTYQDQQKAASVAGRSNVRLDANGVPQVYFEGRWVYEPVTIAAYGLQEYSDYFAGTGSENLFPYAQDLTKWTATSSGSGATPPAITTGAATAPTGGGTADQINFGSGYSYLQLAGDESTINSAGQSFVFSVWLKAPTAGPVYLRVLANGGNAVIAAHISVTTSWQRYWIDGNLGSSDNGLVYARIAKDGTADTLTSVDAWGAQLERGTIPGAYHATDGSVALPKFDPNALTDVENAATWLVSHQNPANGEWNYSFAFGVPGMGITLPAGWGSAMAQGQSISLLARLSDCTGSSADLTAATSALTPLESNVSSGGLADDFLATSHPIYEEYPTSPPSYTLNGFQFTLVGLHDLSLADPSSDAGQLYSSGLATMEYVLPYYDLGDIVAYDLAGLTNPTRPVYAQVAYQCVVVRLLTYFNEIAPNKITAFYQSLWALDVYNGEVNCSLTLTTA